MGVILGDTGGWQDGHDRFLCRVNRWYFSGLLINVLVFLLPGGERYRVAWPNADMFPRKAPGTLIRILAAGGTGQNQLVRN